MKTVPGCTGFKENTLGLDFCYDRTDVPTSPTVRIPAPVPSLILAPPVVSTETLVTVGNDEDPSSAYPWQNAREIVVDIQIGKIVSCAFSAARRPQLLDA